MTKVIADITMSLDGFVTAPNAGPEAGLGDDGMPLHDWVFQGHEIDQALLAETTERSGTVVMGRKLFDIVDSPSGWNDNVGYGAHNVGRPPFFVVTHAPPLSRRLTNLDFTFVTGGVAAAIDQARAICPPNKDVVVMGGANVIAQALDAGLLDKLTLHVSPIVFGGGTPLFDGVARRQLRQTAVLVSPYATHITYSLDAAPS